MAKMTKPDERSRLLARRYATTAVSRSSLKKSEKSVALFLINEDVDLVYFGVGTIAKRLRLSVRSVQRAFREFERLNVLLLSGPQMKGLPRTYSIRLNAFLGLTGGDKNSRRGVTNVTPKPLGDIVTPKCHRINCLEKPPQSNVINFPGRAA